MAPLSTVKIHRPVPLEQKEITDAIDDLQGSIRKLKEAPAPTDCPAHKSLSEATMANCKSNVLSLRLQENIMFELQNLGEAPKSGNFLEWGKLKVGGIAAVIFALVAAILFVLLVMNVDLPSTKQVTEAKTNEHIQ